MALADATIDLSQITLLESQLVRSLGKPKDAVGSSCDKYLKLYATVKPSDVHTRLWEEAQKAVNKKVASS